MCGFRTERGAAISSKARVRFPREGGEERERACHMEGGKGRRVRERMGFGSNDEEGSTRAFHLEEEQGDV